MWNRVGIGVWVLQKCCCALILNIYRICSQMIQWRRRQQTWDQDVILLIDYLPKCQTINAEYYSSLMVQLKDTLKEKCRGKFTNGVLFLHDNAPAYRALSTQKKLAYLGFQCLDHAPYSPDLAPSDYHLFPGLENKWKIAIFLPTQSRCCRGGLVGRTTFWFLFLSGLQKLQQRAN